MSGISVLVTGGTGFVGSAVVKALSETDGFSVLGTSRRPLPASPSSTRWLQVPSIDGSTNWAPHLSCVDVIVHTAASVHVMDAKGSEMGSQFFEINVVGTLRLAKMAAAAGVKRFVFLSSIKVNGEGTPPGGAFTADGIRRPVGFYALSKAEAEIQLLQLAKETGMEVVIVRPPLVYGPGVKANFLSMLRWVDKGIPLPFGGVRNLRSMVAMENLIGFIRICLLHPSAANEVFLISDGDDISTTELLMRTACSLSVSPKLYTLPKSFLVLGASLIGRSSQMQRLIGSLQVDITKNERLLGWMPSCGIDQELARTSNYFKEFQR